MGIAEYSTGNRQENREKATSSLLCFVPPSAISLSCRISSAATESQAKWANYTKILYNTNSLIWPDYLWVQTHWNLLCHVECKTPVKHRKTFSDRFKKFIRTGLKLTYQPMIAGLPIGGDDVPASNYKITRTCRTLAIRCRVIIIKLILLARQSL